MVFTMQKIEVLSVNHGDIREGESIIALQTGGRMSDLETMPFAEAPLLEEGAEYMLFLHINEEGHYLFTGGYQGVAEIVNGTLSFIGQRDDILKRQFDGRSLAFTENVIDTIMTNMQSVGNMHDGGMQE